MSPPIQSIVAGVGELAGHDPALAVALDLAARTGAHLVVVHAFELPQLFSMSPGIEMAFPEGSEEYRAQVQHRLESFVRAQRGAAGAECHALPGPAPHVLAEVAERVRADVLVVGAARASRLEQKILGTTAQRVLRSARVPVLVVRSSVRWPAERVLLTSDLSDLSAAVHERAMEVLGAAYPLEEFDFHSLLVLMFGVAPPLSRETLLHGARSELERFLAERRRGARPPLPVVRMGDAAREIVAEAGVWGADLLVLGTHARRGVPRLWLGSVAEACMRDAPCNILAIPPEPVDAAAPGALARSEPGVPAGVGA